MSLGDEGEGRERGPETGLERMLNVVFPALGERPFLAPSCPGLGAQLASKP